MVDRLYSVKEVIDLTHLSRKQIFYYEDKNLLGNVIRNETNSYRFYTAQQVACLNFIRGCREAGFALEDIKGLLHNKKPHFLRQVVKKSIRNAKKQLSLAIKQYEHRIENYNSLLEASYILENQSQVCGEISIKEIPERYVVYYEYEDYFFNDLMAFAQKWAHLDSIIEKYKLHKLAPRMFEFENHFCAKSGVFKNNKGKIRLMYELSENSTNCPHLRKLPAQNAVSAISVGNYHEDLTATYQKLWKWAAENDYKLHNTSIEEALLEPSFSYSNSNYWISIVSIPIKE